MKSIVYSISAAAFLLYGNAAASGNDGCEIPVISEIISGPSLICSGETATYQVKATGAESFTWELPQGWQGTPQGSTLLVKAGFSGGTLKVTAHNSCGNSKALYLQIASGQVPSPVISANEDNTLMVNGRYASCQWYIDGYAIPGATGAVYAPVQKGEYSVKVSYSNLCEARSKSLTIDEDQALHFTPAKVTLYPNPNQGVFYLKGESPDGHTQLTILDITGRVVYDQSLTVSNGLLNHQVSAAETLPAGIYTIRILSLQDQSSVSFPFVRQ